MAQPKIPRRQLEIITKMYNGYTLTVGVSESSGRMFYVVSYINDNEYFNAGVFARLLDAGLIHQDFEPPFHYILTSKAYKIIEELGPDPE